MNLTPKTLDRLASLAHLDLTPGERRRLVSDLNAIVGFVDRIATQEEDAAPVAIPVPPLTLSEDTIEPSLPTPEALASAPAHTESAVLVKPVETPNG